MCLNDYLLLIPFNNFSTPVQKGGRLSVLMDCNVKSLKAITMDLQSVWGECLGHKRGTS